MTFQIRVATIADIPQLSVHRAAMFSDMGRIHDEQTRAELVRVTEEFLQRTMPTGEYVSWVAVDADQPDRIVAGAGVQRRQSFPFPIRASIEKPTPTGVALGSQAIVMNVYTDYDFRRRGIARALMNVILEWSRGARLDSLVLHASSEGRALYESLGFEGTNEMVIIP